jgi:hypothetical protein
MAGTRRKLGATGPFVEDYRSRLEEVGYTPGSLRGKLNELGHLGRWMSERGDAVAALDEGRVEQFLADLRSRGHCRVPSVASFALLLELLRERQVIAEPVPPPATALDVLIDRYRVWMVKDRGLAPATVLRYENLARRFLQGRVSTDGVDVAGLTGAEVAAFLREECTRVSVGSAKGRVAELRSLLRFLYVDGLTAIALGEAVPPVAGWRNTAGHTSHAAAHQGDAPDPGRRQPDLHPQSARPHRCVHQRDLRPRRRRGQTQSDRKPPGTAGPSRTVRPWRCPTGAALTVGPPPRRAGRRVDGGRPTARCRRRATALRG